MVQNGFATGLVIYCRKHALESARRVRLVVQFDDRTHFEEEEETGFDGISDWLLQKVRRQLGGDRWYICDDIRADEDAEPGELIDLIL